MVAFVLLQKHEAKQRSKAMHNFGNTKEFVDIVVSPTRMRQAFEIARTRHWWPFDAWFNKLLKNTLNGAEEGALHIRLLMCNLEKKSKGIVSSIDIWFVEDKLLLNFNRLWCGAHNTPEFGRSIIAGTMRRMHQVAKRKGMPICDYYVVGWANKLGFVWWCGRWCIYVHETHISWSENKL